MKLKSGVSTTLLANIIFALSQWVIIAGLNYTGNTAVVGQYAFAIAIAGLFLTFGQLGFRQYLLSSIITLQEIQYILSMRLIFSILTFLILIIFCYFFLSPNYFTLILVLGAMKVIENLSDICHGYFQRDFQIKKIVLSRVFRSITSPLFFLIIFYYTENIVAASFGLFISLFITFYFFDKKVISQQGGIFLQIIPMIDLKTITRKAFPMGVATVLVIMVANIPLFVLKESKSDTEVGMYASIFYFVTAGSLVLQSVMQVISPILTKHITCHSIIALKSLIKKSYIMAFGFGFFGILLAVYLGGYVLTFLYGHAFENLQDLIIIAAFINCALAFQAVGGVTLTSFGVFNYQMYCLFISIPICYFSSVFLVSKMGIDGALYASAATSLIIAGLFFIKVFEKLNNIEKN